MTTPPAPAPQDLRQALARDLARRAGLSPAAVLARGEAARDDAGLCEGLAAAFVASGAYILEDPTARRIRLEELGRLPAMPELESALDRRRARPLSSDERLRLARLYALIGCDEKGAAAYRELLAPLPLALAIDVAEAAARSDSAALALAGIDRVAEIVLTRDASGERELDEPDPLRDDPLGAGALLERARDIALSIDHAPRAVALARAATALYERIGRRQEARESLSGQARALEAAGRGKRARATAERWRALAREDGAAMAEARAIGWLAREEANAGAFKAAADLHGEARAVLSRAGDAAAAVRHAARRGVLLVQGGDLQAGRDALAEALALPGVEPSAERTLRLEVARIDLALGRVGPALATAEAARKDGGDDKGPLAVAAATLHVEALLLAGDLDRAARAASRVSLALHDAAASRHDALGLRAAAPADPNASDPGDDDEGALEDDLDADWPAAPAPPSPALVLGRLARVRAELAVVAGRPAEAALLCLDASRLLLEGGARTDAAEAVLRRAEVELEDDDPDACRRDLKRALRLAEGLAPRLELRMELLRAGMAEPDEAELLLDEVTERAPLEGDPWTRGLAAAARVRAMIHADRVEDAAAAARAHLEALAPTRDALPDAARAAFRRSPWLHALDRVARETVEKAPEVLAALDQLMPGS